MTADAAFSAISRHRLPAAREIILSANVQNLSMVGRGLQLQTSDPWRAPFDSGSFDLFRVFRVFRGWMELEKVRQAPGSIASRYPTTQAGIKARQALQATVASPALPPVPLGFDVPYPKK